MIRLLQYIIFCFMLLCFYRQTTVGAFFDHFIDDPDVHKNLTELITSKGYPVEDYTVQTGDGYLLSLLRIPYGRNNDMQGEDKDVVLFIHGILADATSWFLNFPGQSLGFVLPDKGYDAWFINIRGCKYSRRHITYNTQENRFWNFSFDQKAQYDVPNTVDYILNATGKEDLYLIGMSEGCTETFAMLSDRPDYNKKVKLFIALAPVVFTGHITFSATLPSPAAYGIYYALEVLTSGEFLPDNNIMLCAHLPKFCEEFDFAIVGKDRQQLNEEEPPEYNLSSITTPIALFWSSNDKIATARDVAILRKRLTSLVFSSQVPYYNHSDFLLALNAPKLINEPVLQLLANY